MRGFLDFLFRRGRWDKPAAGLYGSCVAQARRPEFYAAAGVADTVPGRIEMISLHVFLVLRRLRAAGKAKAGLGQALFDLMFDDFDRSLRELGVGDLGVGPRIKALAKGFYGRIAAYDAALKDPDALAVALARNVFAGAKAGEQGARLLAAYLVREAEAMDAYPLEALARGEATFGPPPTAPD